MYMPKQLLILLLYMFLTLGAKSFAMTNADVDYLQSIKQAVENKWIPVVKDLGQQRQVSIVFRVDPDGVIHNVRVRQSSTLMLSDSAALKAISVAAPFAKPPSGKECNILSTFTSDHEQNIQSVDVKYYEPKPREKRK